MALRPSRAKARHAQVDDVRLDPSEIVVTEADPLDDIDAVVVEHGIRFRDYIVKNFLSLWMFEIDCEGALVAVKFQKARR